MRIALLWPDYWPYIRRGTERMVHDIARYQLARGDVVDIIASKPGPSRVQRSPGLTIRHLGQVDHPLVRYYSARLGRFVHRFDTHAFQILPQLLSERYDVVHVFVFVYAPAVALARALRGSRIVYHVVMIPPTWGRPFDEALLRRCFAMSSSVRVFSRFCRDEVARTYGVEGEIVPPTVDPDVFFPVAPRALDRQTVLYTADLVQLPKGPHVLARAFNLVHRERPDTVLQLAGPVGFRPEGVKEILRLIEPGARGAVEIVGPGALEDLPRLYSRASVTVLPSLGEPFGMVLTESLSCGTPVVGTRSGAIPEIIDDQAIGALFERDDSRPDETARSLADAVLRVLDLARDPASVRRCRQHARRWTWATVGPAFDALHADRRASVAVGMRRSA